MIEFYKTVHTSEVPLGKAKLIEISGKMLAIFHTSSGWFALDDRCTHRGGPLSEGQCLNGVVTCPWHQARFELVSGNCLSSDSLPPLKTYPVRLNQDVIEIGLLKNDGISNK